MNVIPGYAIQVIPSDLGTLIALDRDRLETDVAEVIQEEETDFAKDFDFRCEVIDAAVLVNKGRVRVSTPGPNIAYATQTVLQTTLSGFLPDEEGDIFIEAEVIEDLTQPTVTDGAGGVVTFAGNPYNYAAQTGNNPKGLGFPVVTKGVMPPSTMNRIRIRLAEYSVDEDGVISLTQTHFGPITVLQPTQHSGFAIFFRIV